jgi:SAM-dependent methyltransferase
MPADSHARATYTSDQFAPLFAAESRHFWFEARNRCIAAAIASIEQPGSVHHGLEVGCGTGAVLRHLKASLPGAHVVGMDLFQEALDLARRRFDGSLVRADVLKSCFHRPFDLVGAFDVIEHLDDDVSVLRTLAAYLRPGGHLLVTVPAHTGLWSYFDEVALHRRRYAVAELRRKLEGAGFTNVFVTQFMAALYPFMWVKRRLIGQGARRIGVASRDAQQAAAESDLAVGAVINGMFRILSSPDAALIARRLPLPIGTSLLAIGTRPPD